MIIVLLSIWLVGWSLTMLLRRVAVPPTRRPTLSALLKRRHPSTSRPLSLEDDPTRWPPPPLRGDWTALDERQLIRLLTDSAMPPPANDSP